MEKIFVGADGCYRPTSGLTPAVGDVYEVVSYTGKNRTVMVVKTSRNSDEFALLNLDTGTLGSDRAKFVEDVFGERYGRARGPMIRETND